MITSVSSDIVIALGPLHFLLNHLWQSTLFAAVAGLLTLAFRDSRARWRHWIWLAASVKFLLPFAALEALGRQVGWPVAAGRAEAALHWSLVAEEISRPFNQPVLLMLARPAPGPLPWTRILLAVWLAGTALVLARWAVRWLRLVRIRRGAVPLEDARVQDLLRRAAGGTRAIPVLVSQSTLEPGVFGVLRPVLILPAGIAERLSDEQLQAVLAHELAHVRRRDNLTGALHMLVEAAFWFHPLVWWLGTRMIQERERACDEAVLEQANEPQVYAESILKVCKFYLEAELACVAGVSGADLKKRIEEIMTQSIGRNPGWGRRLLLGATSVAMLAAPVVVGLMSAPRSQAQTATTAGGGKKFEVAAIKPSDPSIGHRIRIEMAPGGRFVVEGITLKGLMQQAYGIRDFQIQGAPDWAARERYDINAKGEGEVSRDDVKPMLQALLEDRFQLKVRRETKEMPTYTLVVAKGGAKMKQSESGDRENQMMRMGRGLVNASGITMGGLASMIAQMIGQPVADKTGLAGQYDVKLEWTPDESETAMIRQMHPDAPPAPPLDSSGPSIYTAVQEQLGLKLESAKGPVEIFIIERVEKPSEN